MTITAAQAQAELDRRSKAGAGGAAPAQGGGITAAQAQAELDRRAASAEPDVMKKLHDPNTLLGKPLQIMDDLTNVSGDAVTRGFGGNDMMDAATRASRERLGWGAVPVDVVSAVASSPYRIGSMGAGAIAGAAEGAASAYGHQEGWVPGWDVLKGAAIGAGAGAFGAKAGEWLGGKAAAKEAEAALTPDAAAIANADQILATKGMTRDDFAKALADAPPELQAKIAEIAGGKSLTSRVGAAMPKTLTEGGIDRTLLTGLTLGPKAVAARLGAQGLKAAGESDWANKVPDQAIEALAESVRKGEINIDPAIVDKWRDAAARIGIGYGRSP